MAINSDTKKRYMKTGVFKTESEAVSYVIPKLIADSSLPAGAWSLKEELDKQGIHYGTATVGRYLKELDGKGITEQKSNLGRVLTAKGQEWVQKLEANVARAEILNETTKAIRLDDYTDLVDLIEARKAIEISGVALAVDNATEEDLTMLRETVIAHYRCVAEKKDPTDPALRFPLEVAEISHNKFIESMLSMLIYEERNLEQGMEKLLTRERGSDYVVEHNDICAAIAKRDKEQAVALMESHLNALLDAVREQIQLMSEENDEIPGKEQSV